MIYYEKYKDLYTNAKHASQTFSSGYSNYTKDSSQSCLVATPSLTQDHFDITNYDCDGKAYSVCQMFQDPNIELTTTPSPAPIYVHNYTTEMQNFNCLLTNLEDHPSDKRRKRNDVDLTTTEITKTHSNKLEFLLSPSKSDERKERYKTGQQTFMSDFGNLDMSISYPYLFELLWYSQLPCTDVKTLTSGYRDEKSFLKRCYWEEKEVACHSIFKMKATDRGMCCSFNSKGLEHTLRDGIYRRVAKTLQSQDTELAFDNLEDEGITKEQEDATFMGKPGRGKGLMVFLDAHADRISSGSVFDDFVGFPIVVDGSDQFPMTYQKSFLLQPGYENTVALSATEIVSDPDIRGIPEEKRNCYFSDEHPLELHLTYSQSNCFLECTLKQTFQKTSNLSGSSQRGCKPWFYPSREVDAGFCNPWRTSKFIYEMAKMSTANCSHCLPDCNTTLYEASVSTAPIRYCDHTNLGASGLCNLDKNLSTMNPSLLSNPVRNEFWISQIGMLPDYVAPSIDNLPSTRIYQISKREQKHLTFKSNFAKNREYDAFRKDIALVNFYFEHAHVQKYKRQPRLKNEDFIAQLGGLFGLAIGVSLISVFETFWYFVILPMVYCTQNKKNVQVICNK